MASEITVRRGTPDDLRACFDLSMAAVGDLFARQGIAFALDPGVFWDSLESILEHVSRTAAEWWVAVDESDGALAGYSRSVQRDGLFELTELFVRPDRQSAGLGRRLIELAFPAGRGEVRAIVATTDVRALARYYGAGTVARFPIATMSGAPRAAAAAGVAPDVAAGDGAPDVAAGDGAPDADAVGLEATPATLDDIAALAAIETAVLGFPRDDDYPWLIENREGHLYRRAGRPVGFAFVSPYGSGPIAAFDPADQVPILLHAEARAHALGMGDLSLEVPMPNEIAMRHLLRRGFRIEPPLGMLMSSVPFGQFDRFIPFGPSLML